MKEELVKEWFGRGREDMEVVQILVSKGGYLDIALFHLHQAVEKYLKGFLIHRGWDLRKSHDLESLLTEALHFYDRF